MALVRNDTVVLMDLFGSAELYRRGHAKIAKGMLADVDTGGVLPRDAPSLVRQAIASLVSATAVRRQAPGSGDTLHGTAGRLIFGAVAHHGEVYHAVVATA